MTAATTANVIHLERFMCPFWPVSREGGEEREFAPEAERA